MALVLGFVAAPARATQRLSLGPDVNSLDECGVAIPISMIRSRVRHALIDLLVRNNIAGPTADVWTEWHPGDDDTTSEEDTFDVEGDAFSGDIVLFGQVKVRFWLVPGQTDRHPDLQTEVNRYSCSGQSGKPADFHWQWETGLMSIGYAGSISVDLWHPRGNVPLSLTPS